MDISFERRNKTATTTTWITPREIIIALGPFDTDPCCPPVMPWQTAEVQYTEKENGLLQEWKGRVWLNPPYGKEMPPFLKKMAAHRNGIALIPARMEIAALHDLVFPFAHALFFKKGRINFCDTDGQVPEGSSNGVGSLFVSYDPISTQKLTAARIAGYLFAPSINQS